MRNILLEISYDGSLYHGWQVQKNAVSVQQVLQDALEKLLCERPDVKGCSRTDSGVHANSYFVSFKTDKGIKTENVLTGLNTYLPKSIAVKSCREVAEDFHPRYSAVSKEYIYKLYNGKIRNPFLNNYAFHYRYPINAEYLNSEAKAFLGTHDFKGFCSARSDVGDTVRTVKRFDVFREGDMVFFRVEADGFLYNMVRIMVGTLLFVNEGKIKSGELAEIISGGERKRAGKTAAPQGLYLNRVNYE